MDVKELSTNLEAAIHTHNFVAMRDAVGDLPPSDVAALIEELDGQNEVLLFRVLPRKLAAETFSYMSSDRQETLLRAMSQEEVAAILNEMAPDDRTTLLEELPGAATKQLLTLLSPKERAVATTLLGYPENSVGRLMTPDYLSIHPEWTVAQALDYVRKYGHDSETLNILYVIDDRGFLLDDIRMRRFLLAPLDTQVAELMDDRVASLKATDDQEAAVMLLRQTDLTALPVTDSDGMLIGIVTVDDVMDVAEIEATEDIQKIGGSEALDEPYLAISFNRMVRKRAGWLVILFLSEMLTATAMSFFEIQIQRAVVLALFIPLIISSGGNSGSQAATLVIRAMALGEVKLTDWWRVMKREFLSGLALGSVLDVIGFLRISIWSMFSTIYGPYWYLVAVTIAFALIGIVLWGTLAGSMLPILLRRLGFDPATSSAPFVATLVDVTGLIIYFSVAIVVLRGTLL